MEKPTINAERLAATFMELVQIDSVSKEEGALCHWLKKAIEELGVKAVVDRSAGLTQSNTGNLVGFFDGHVQRVSPLLLSAHMDTVEPGRNVTPVLKHGVFRSAGETILGGDDKCGIAIILETLRIIKEQNLPCGPLELVFTTCEEIGMLGSKNLDYTALSSNMGYVLDTRDPDAIITQAPAANRLTLSITGKAAHAGSSPEKGINAIALAAKAIASLEWGRLDDETTCNVGMIEGGIATNIVPPIATVHCEVRSHDVGKLQSVTDNIIRCFQQAVGEQKMVDGDCANFSVDVDSLFGLLSLGSDHEVITLAKKAAEKQRRKLKVSRSSGGSDANIMNTYGIQAVVLGTGCEKVHTVDEAVALEDMVRGSELLIEIVRLHTQRAGR